MIKIVTDSTCDIPAGWLKAYNITVVPVNIQFGLETFQEGVTITPNTFYRRIETDSVLPTTSQASVGQLCQVYQDLAADGSEILSIHLTSKLSGTWQAALLAAKQLKNSVKVSVFDSFTGSVGLGFMVREAAQLVAAGFSAQEIIERLEARRVQINIFILLKDLRYARLSGRVGRVKESLSSLLSIRPIIGVEHGALVLKERVRGQKKGFAHMLTVARQVSGSRPVHVAVAHAIAPAAAESLLAQACNQLNCKDTFISDLALSIAVHFGPGTVGIVTYPAE